jgi:hypothetical protein
VLKPRGYLRRVLHVTGVKRPGRSGDTRREADRRYGGTPG